MLIGHYTCWDLKSKTRTFIFWQNITHNIKKVSCPFFKEHGQIVHLNNFTQQAHTVKKTASVLMLFVLTAILCSKLDVAFCTFVPVKRYVHVSMKTIWNMAVKRENGMILDKIAHKKKVSLSMRERVWVSETVSITENVK